MINNQVISTIWKLLKLKHKDLRDNELMTAVVQDLVQLERISGAVFKGVCEEAVIHIKIGNY